MKGNAALVDTLNSLLKGEVTAINQYMLHTEMCDDWGYGKLAASLKDRAITEMRHAERLIERILFLEGTPVVSSVGEIIVGKDVPAQVENDLALELDTVRAYNEAIALAAEVPDFATRDILAVILADEDGHVDALEELQDQMEQMTLPVFLSTKA